MAILISVSLHAAALMAVVGLVRGGTRLSEQADKSAEVELVMIERRGAGDTTVTEMKPEADRPAVTPPPPAPQPTPEPPPPDPPQPSKAEEPPRPMPPDPEPPRPTAKAGQASKAEDRAPLSINLGGTDSETNAIASGDNIIPAKPDNRSRNRPPVYPIEAARRRQHGNVVLLIHVSRDGGTTGVDVMKSSGFAVLDDAARDAVAAWRFVPAIKDGMPVPFDMAMDFRFELTP